MKHCFFGHLAPPWHLAMEEALLDSLEERWSATGDNLELLCFWEPQDYFVVVGYANQVAAEVNLETCQQSKTPIYRRSSGGGTVLQGPGCLNYALMLRIREDGPTGTISATNRYCMERNQAVLARLLERQVRIAGHTDLTLDNLKLSGNAQRRRKHYLLFHGCFLLNMDMERIEQALRMPGKQPDYRARRSHLEFLINARVESASVARALIDDWEARQDFHQLPMERAGVLVETKYSRAEWNFKF